MCPRCSYSVLGLPVAGGDIVTCPECGLAISLSLQGWAPQDIMSGGRAERAPVAGLRRSARPLLIMAGLVATSLTAWVISARDQFLGAALLAVLLPMYFVGIRRFVARDG